MCSSKDLRAWWISFIACQVKEPFRDWERNGCEIADVVLVVYLPDKKIANERRAPTSATRTIPTTRLFNLRHQNIMVNSNRPPSFFVLCMNLNLLTSYLAHNSQCQISPFSCRVILFCKKHSRAVVGSNMETHGCLNRAAPWEAGIQCKHWRWR